MLSITLRIDQWSPARQAIIFWDFQSSCWSDWIQTSFSNPVVPTLDEFILRNIHWKTNSAIAARCFIGGEPKKKFFFWTMNWMLNRNSFRWHLCCSDDHGMADWSTIYVSRFFETHLDFNTARKGTLLTPAVEFSRTTCICHVDLLIVFNLRLVVL